MKRSLRHSHSFKHPGLLKRVSLLLAFVAVFTLVWAPEANAQSQPNGETAAQTLAAEEFYENNIPVCQGGGPVETLALNRWGAHTSTVWRGEFEVGFFDIGGNLRDISSGVLGVLRNLLYMVFTTPAYIVWVVVSWLAVSVLPGIADMTCSPYMSDFLLMVNEYFGKFKAAIDQHNLIALAILIGVMFLMPLLVAGGARSSRFTSAFIAFILPLAMLTAMGMVTPASTSVSDLQPGQPAWLVFQALRVTEAPVWGLTGSVMNSMGTRNFGSGIGGPGDSGLDGRGCGTYINNLYGGAGADTHPVSEVISATWETTRLQAWYYAQFGEFDVGQLIGCRILEAKAGVPPHEQARIQGGGAHPDIFLNGEDDPDGLFKMIGWLWCSGNEYGYLLEADGQNKEQACNEWWSSGKTGWGIFGGMVGKLGDGKYDDYREARNKAIEAAKNDGKKQAAIHKEYLAIQSMAGTNAGVSLMTTVVTGPVALIEAFGVGTLLSLPMVGMLLSLVVITMTVALLPVTLLFFAIGEARKYKAGGFIGDNQIMARAGSIGRKMLGWTAMALGSKAIFTLMLAGGLLFLDVAHRIVGIILEGTGPAPVVSKEFNPVNPEFLARIVGVFAFFILGGKALAAAAQQKWGVVTACIVSAAVGVLLTFNPGVVLNIINGVADMFRDVVGLFG